MKPGAWLARLTELEERGRMLEDVGRQAALNAMAGKRFPGHIVSASPDGVHVTGPRAAAVGKRLADSGGRAAVKAMREGLR